MQTTAGPAYPRFQGEHWIRSYLKELNHYAEVFHQRFLPAFASLDEEAQRIEDAEYERLGQFFDPEHGDPAYGAEQAYFKGVDFYLAMDSVRQGMINLTIAGLFHMLEQQAQYLATHVFPNRIAPVDSGGGLNQLRRLLSDRFGINVMNLQSWSVLEQLRLLANTIKHGDGRSATEMRTKYPELFKDASDPLPVLSGLPLRPLAGEGLRLTEDHFDKFKACIESFWGELTEKLLPVLCPNSHA